MSNRSKGLWSLHLGLILFGGTSLFPKLIPLDSIQLTGWRSLIACSLLLLVVFIFKQQWRLNSTKEYWQITLLGLAMAFHWVTYFHAIQLSTVAIGMLAVFTYPVIIVLLEPYINKTPFHRWMNIR